MPGQPANAGGPLRDGRWAGQMAVGATIDFSTGAVGLVASGTGRGTFDLSLAGGVASGDYLFTGTSSAVFESDVDSGEGESVSAVSGSIEGSASGPILQPQVGHIEITGTMSVGSVVVPFDIPFDYGPDEMLSSTLNIVASSCTIASGTWAQEFRAAVEASGASVSNFQGSWSATFVGVNAAATNDALADMLQRGEAIIEGWVSSGTLDEDGMESLLVEAEMFAASAPATDACGAASRGAWASPLAGLVQRLLEVIVYSNLTTPEILRFGVAAGLRTATLPSVGSDTLESGLMTKAGELLAAAIAADDRAAIVQIAVAANSMGWTEIANSAIDALGIP